METKGTLVGLHPPCFSSVRPHTPSRPSTHNPMSRAKRGVRLGSKRKAQREMWQKQCGARAANAWGRSWNLLRNRVFGVQLPREQRVGNLSPYPDQNHALHSSGGKTLTLFEQLERGVSIVHLICVGAIRAPASEKGLQKALVPVDSNHSLTLPRRRGGPGRGRAGVSP